jgi:hypothetical protein
MKTVAVRVPDDWKDRMERTNVKWSDILREAILENLERIERAEQLTAYLARPSSVRTEAGTAVKSIREDRDGS